MVIIKETCIFWYNIIIYYYQSLQVVTDKDGIHGKGGVRQRKMPTARKLKREELRKSFSPKRASSRSSSSIPTFQPRRSNHWIIKFSYCKYHKILWILFLNDTKSLFLLLLQTISHFTILQKCQIIPFCFTRARFTFLKSTKWLVGKSCFFYPCWTFDGEIQF